MKFVIESFRGGCRLGVLSELGTQTDSWLPPARTPMCMVYTKTGSAPYLSRDVFQRIENIPPIVHMACSHLAEHAESLTAFSKGVHSFTAIGNHAVFCGTQDSAKPVRPGYNNKHAVAVWGHTGKIPLTVERHCELMDALKPNMCQALSDSDTDISSTKKRVQKSVDNTLAFLDKCVVHHSSSQSLHGSSLLGVLVGGHIEEERVRCARRTAEHKNIQGYVVEGLYNFGPDSESFKLESVTNLLHKSFKQLPVDRLRILPGVLAPDSVLHAVQIGIDIMDSSYPCVVAERGSALNFEYQLSQTDPQNGAEVTLDHIECPDDVGDKSNVITCSPDTRPGFEISLKDQKYASDLRPLVDKCECYTCSHHTRAYVNHLLCTGELLAGILLTIHNFHHYFGFFETVRQSLRDNRFEELKSKITKQGKS